MNIILRLKGKKTLITSILVAQLIQPLCAQIASFSEPEVIFYGQVCSNEDPANCTILNSGTLVWTLSPPVGDPIIVTTELAAYPNGMSYVLKIPAEALVAGTQISANALPTGAVSVNYDRSSVTVGGTPYLIGVPGGANKNSLAYGSLQRGHMERIDLVLTGLEDSDNDGMSDAFENLYAADGLNPNDPNDATGDIDGDGSNNLAEFLAGTDPNGFDYPTWAAIPSTALAVAEREKTLDKDGDGMSNWLEFAIGSQPSVSDTSFANGVIQSSFVTVGPDKHFALTFAKPSARRLGVSYAIEWGSGLSGPWERVAGGNLILLQDTKTTLQARETNPATSKGFLRLAADEL
jgi:hypothetical protein